MHICNNKNSNMQQKKHSVSILFLGALSIFNIFCVLVFMVVLDMSYCLSDVGMWASSLSWQFESRGRSSHSFLMSTGSLISTRWAPFVSPAQCTLIKKQTEERERGEEGMSIIYDIICFILLVMWFWCQENTRL